MPRGMAGDVWCSIHTGWPRSASPKKPLRFQAELDSLMIFSGFKSTLRLIIHSLNHGAVFGDET